MPADQIGYPSVCKEFEGVDSLGQDVSIATSVSIWNRSQDGAPPGVIKIGNNVTIMANVRMVLTDRKESPGSGIEIKDNVIVNYGSFLSGEGGLFIGKNVLIGPYAMFLSGGHTIDSMGSIYSAPLINKPIYLDDECWVGANAKIIGGVKIGYGAVIAAGAVVNRSIPPHAVVAGMPARIVGFRKLAGYSAMKSFLYRMTYNQLSKTLIYRMVFEQNSSEVEGFD